MEKEKNYLRYILKNTIKIIYLKDNLQLNKINFITDFFENLFFSQK